MIDAVNAVGASRILRRVDPQKFGPLVWEPPVAQRFLSPPRCQGFQRAVDTPHSSSLHTNVAGACRGDAEPRWMAGLRPRWPPTSRVAPAADGTAPSRALCHLQARAVGMRVSEQRADSAITSNPMDTSAHSVRRRDLPIPEPYATYAAPPGVSLLLTGPAPGS